MDKTYIPKTVPEAMQFWDEHLSEQDKQYVRDAKLDEHGNFHGLAHMGLRNAWNLWGTQEDKPRDLFDFFCHNGLPCNPMEPCAPGDDISSILSTCYWHHIHGADIDPLSLIPSYVEYWKKPQG